MDHQVLVAYLRQEADRSLQQWRYERALLKKIDTARFVLFRKTRQEQTLKRIELHTKRTKGYRLATAALEHGTTHFTITLLELELQALDSRLPLTVEWSHSANQILIDAWRDQREHIQKMLGTLQPTALPAVA